MSLFDSYDPDSPEVISPGRVFAPIEGFPEMVLVTYSRTKLQAFLEAYDHTEIASINTACSRQTIWKTTVGDREYAFVLSLIGSAAAAAIMEELIAMGVRRFLYFGSCGVLDASILEGHIAVPTHAYRDEGVSYHYLPVADYIEIETAPRLVTALDSLEVPHHETRTWTTDAFYRETRGHVQRRKDEGCRVVEMEAASTAAVAKFRGVEFFQFLYGADSLDGFDWDPRTLVEEHHDSHHVYVNLAFEIASELHR